MSDGDVSHGELDALLGQVQQLQEQAARQAARQAAANKPRTIDGINTVWLEELTQPEFRDMIKDGYTTVLIMTGGVENNDGNLQMNKHNINNRLLGEMLARKMGKTLVAPLVKVPSIGPGSYPGISRMTPPT